MTTTPSQSTTPRRILAPDAARGLMLLLIAMAYAGVYVGAGFGVDASQDPIPDRAATFAATLFLDNRAFPLFAILFGYGLAWSVARQSSRNVEADSIRRTMRRRALLLLLFGAVHAVLVFPGEILTSYGFALLITGWLLFRSERALNIALLVTGVFYIVTVPLVMVAEAAGPEDASTYAIPGYTTLGDWAERVAGVPFAPVYVAIAYPLLFLVILGYRAGRARLFESPESHRSLLRLLAWSGIGISLIGALPGALAAIGAFQPGPLTVALLMGLQILTGVAGGVGYAACFALGAEQLERVAPAVTRAVAAIGKRSLTFYIFNSVLVAIVLHAELFGAGTRVGHLGALAVAAAVWSAGLLLAAWLERAGRPGPLEALMRRGIYGRA